MLPTGDFRNKAPYMMHIEQLWDVSSRFMARARRSVS